jgi:hypothetical protein
MRNPAAQLEGRRKAKNVRGEAEGKERQRRETETERGQREREGNKRLKAGG